MRRWHRILATFILTAVCLGVAEASAEDTINVNAVGVGATGQSAEKNALVSAVQQAVGLYLDSETLVKNEQLIYDSVLSVSDGYVTKYDVLVPAHKRPSDGLYETTIRAVVQKAKVGAELQKLQMTQAVSTQDAWAESVTMIKSAQDAVELMKRRWPDMQTGLLKARLVPNRAGGGAVRPEIQPDPSTGHVWCGWNIEVTLDRHAYYDKIEPILQKVFNALADQRLQDFNVEAPSTAPMTIPAREPDYYVRRSAFLGTPLRFPREARDGERVPMPDRANEFVVCLDHGSDKSRQNMRWSAWTLSRRLYEKWLPGLFNPYALKIAFLDGSGALVVDGTCPLDKTLLMPTAFHQGRAVGMIGPKLVSISTCLSPLASNFSDSRFGGSSTYWISPDFKSENPVPRSNGSSTGYLDNLMLHYEMSLDPDDMKRIASVQFSFMAESAGR